MKLFWFKLKQNRTINKEFDYMVNVGLGHFRFNQIFQITLTHLCPPLEHLLSERLTSLGQQMLELGCENTTVSKNGLRDLLKV